MWLIFKITFFKQNDKTIVPMYNYMYSVLVACLPSNPDVAECCNVTRRVRLKKYRLASIYH